MPRCSKLGLLIVIGLFGCSQVEPPPENGELVVAVRNSPAYYQVEKNRVSGFDHDLAELFADDLGLKLRFVVARDPAELSAMVRDGKAHLATSMAVRNHADGLRYTTPLRQARQLLIEHADDPPIESEQDLAGLTIDALAGSPQADLLQSMIGNAATFKLKLRSDSNDIDLLEQIVQHRSELAASDDDQFAIAMNFYPDLKIAYVLPNNVSYAWAFPLVENSTLYDKAQEFLERIRQDGTLASIVDRYFGHLERVSDADINGFLVRMQTVLPHFRADFISAQRATGLDWRLLAALAYQESHWNPLATSPTGVRGMMMLTGETADRLRVTNRLDAKQSILAGARYFADLIDQLPADIANPDRIWMALAAYNLGMGHMNGARAIAKGIKRDPASWYEMKQVLPLLAREKYYNRLKSGRGRGGEAVIMVENIRTYYDILTRFQPHYTEVPVFPEFKLR